jgi:large subunit ribosomal protein L33
MAKKGDKRKLIGLICGGCDARHYYTSKNTMNTTDKISLKKYCPTNRGVETHTETKKNLGRNEAPKR